ncbi:hypothetical protein CDAR_517051 [Caerostris darwini]|uniref:Uncharacterized protein n=1 Tax=Caerostris darwini TaxID=1538125 RepID=A0AAV4UE02_9ARAC|nr:hypothetical protein CDAR_517051 [Caerostris darwini]
MALTSPPLIRFRSYSLLPLHTQGNHTSNFSGCPRNPANFVPAAPPKTNYWEERMKMMKTNKLPLSAPTSLQNTISTNSVKMDKSPPNQVEPQLSGPSTSSSTPQENLTAQILQSLLKRCMFSPQI